MTFKKSLVVWLLITALSGAAFYIVKTVFPGHPLWPWIFVVLYPGFLILFVLYLLSPKGEKK